MLALGPLFLGIWMVRRAEATGGSKTHGRLVLLLEVPWLAALWGWLFTGGTTARITVAGTVFALAVWYGMTLRDEARQGHEDA
ncbi:hypothetical protein ACFV5G_30290 [Streptomyces sp. NPDC059766]|uniref:hypothetical protein n=1 Tax=Streptomyces sp. NPDC059766 TaxID=3346940 RepID=UPI00365D4875